MPVTDEQKFKLLILQARFLKEKFSMHKQLEQEAMENFSIGFKERLKTLPDEIKEYFKDKDKSEDPIPEDKDEDHETKAQQTQEESCQEEFSDEVPPERKEIKRHEAPKRLRDVYKKIAKITHPDKLKGMSELEQLQKELLFKKAQQAVSSGDYVELMDVALHLNIEFPEPTEEDTKHVRKKIENIRNKINKIERSAAWQWYHAREKDKPSVMKDYIYYIYQNEMR